MTGSSSLLLRPWCAWPSGFKWSKHRQHSDQFINVGRMSPRAVAEQGLLRGSSPSFAILQLLLPSCSLPSAAPAALPSHVRLSGSMTRWEPTVEQRLSPYCCGKSSFLRTCCCNHRLWLIPAQKHRAVTDHKIAHQRSVCPEQLHYHMHNNVYSFTSDFSAKVNRNFTGVAFQTLRVELEAQHKYKGASECKYLLWILESSSAQVCVWMCMCVCTCVSPHTGVCRSQGCAPTRIPALMLSHLIHRKGLWWAPWEQTKSAAKLLKEKWIQCLWYLIQGGNFGQIHFQYCWYPLKQHLKPGNSS